MKRASLSLLKSTTKRERLIFATLVVSTLALVSVFTPGRPQQFMMAGLTLASIIGLTYFALWEDLAGFRYVIIPVFPAALTLATLGNAIVLPLPAVLKIGAVALFGAVMYFVLLISNIFTISASRTIPLKRAAHAASFFLHIVIIFLLVFFLIVLKLQPLLVCSLAFLIVLLPALYLYWSFDLERLLSRRDVAYAVGTALIIGESALVLAFWPVSPLYSALFITTIFYLVSGVLHHASVNRLTTRVLIEYCVVLAFAGLLLVVTGQWSG